MIYLFKMLCSINNEISAQTKGELYHTTKLNCDKIWAVKNSFKILKLNITVLKKRSILFFQKKIIFRLIVS